MQYVVNHVDSLSSIWHSHCAISNEYYDRVCLVYWSHAYV